MALKADRPDSAWYVMLSIRCLLVFATVILLTFSAVHVPFCVYAVTEDEAKSAITSAEQNVIACYQAVAEAEKAGANTTELLVVLNEAGALLSKAHLSFKNEDFDSANNFASLSQEKLIGFIDRADALRATAAQQGYWDFMVFVVGSLAGTVAVVFGGFVAWTVLKKRYAKAEGVAK
jgi:hypothetical protein